LSGPSPALFPGKFGAVLEIEPSFGAEEEIINVNLRWFWRLIPVAIEGIRWGNDKVCCFKAVAAATGGRGIFVFGQIERGGFGVFLHRETGYCSGNTGRREGHVFRKGEDFREAGKVFACQPRLCGEMQEAWALVWQM
jgi:hypothetical protein